MVGPPASRLLRLLARALFWHVVVVVLSVAFVLGPELSQVSITDIPSLLVAFVVAVVAASLLLLSFAGVPLIVSVAILEGWSRPVGTSPRGLGQRPVRISALIALGLIALLFGFSGAYRLLMLR